MLKKAIRTLVAVGMATLLCASTAFAGDSVKNVGEDFEQENPAMGWSELEESLYNAKAPKESWVLRSTKTVNVTSGKITLKSYTQELLNNTKLAKGVTTHSSRFYGYVRARFESVTGTVLKGSDSGRIYSYNGTTAEIPFSPDATGWTGIANTYCDEA